MNDFLSVVSQKFEKDLTRIYPKIHRISSYSIRNRGGTSIVKSLVRVHPRKIHTKFEVLVAV